MSEDIPVSAVEDNALPSLDGVVDEDMPVGEAEDRLHSPRERPLASDDWGTTAREERMGEPLDVRLAREEPDLAPSDVPLAADPYPVGSPSAGRLVEPDEGARGDDEADLVATDVGRDRGLRSAEEAAMTIRPDAPGGSWSPSGDYVEGDAVPARDDEPDLG